MNSQLTFSVISSPELADGHTRSRSRAGRLAAQSGPEAAHASHSVRPEKGLGQPTLAISGQSSHSSSAPASLQRSLASRLQAALGVNGSAEYSLTWREWAIPGQEPICALRASVPRTSVNGCSGWQSPVASEARQGFQDRSRGKKGTQQSLTTQAILQSPPPHLQHLRLGHAEFQRLEGHSRDEHHGNQPGWNDTVPARSIAETSGAGHWRVFDLLRCTDGKARRVEPGTFPLAHGVPGRVGLLRGYGNAIVPQVAQAFIEAFLTSHE